MTIWQKSCNVSQAFKVLDTFLLKIGLHQGVAFKKRKRENKIAWPTKGGSHSTMPTGKPGIGVEEKRFVNAVKDVITCHRFFIWF